MFAGDKHFGLVGIVQGCMGNTIAGRNEEYLSIWNLTIHWTYSEPRESIPHPFQCYILCYICVLRGFFH
jgi:hypothetical protein